MTTTLAAAAAKSRMKSSVLFGVVSLKTLRLKPHFYEALNI